MTRKSANSKMALIDVLNSSPNWELDRWGNYKYCGTSLKGSYRFKFQDTSVRFEKKGTNTGTWLNIASDYYKNIVIDQNQNVRIGTMNLSGIKLF